MTTRNASNQPIHYTDAEIAEVRALVAEGWRPRDVALAYGFPFGPVRVSKSGRERRDPWSYFYTILRDEARAPLSPEQVAARATRGRLTR